MPDYPFTNREQDVIRELGRAGFRYRRETKKTIEFVDSNERVVELNREHTELALVFGFGDQKKLERVLQVKVSGPRSSSNFGGLRYGTTRTGRTNHQGFQVLFENSDTIQRVVARLSP